MLASSGNSRLWPRNTDDEAGCAEARQFCHKGPHLAPGTDSAPNVSHKPGNDCGMDSVAFALDLIDPGTVAAGQFGFN